MSIRVNLPGGSVANFPDGTSEAEITQALSSFGGGQQATPAPKSATIGMMAQSTPTSDPKIPRHLIDLVPENMGAQRDADRINNSLGFAIPTPSASAVSETVGKVPGVVARAAGVSKARAGANLAAVEQAAGDVAVNPEGVGQVGLRAMELKDAGGRLPRVASQLMQRITNPDAGDLTFQEARDFYSNLSRMSANDFNSLNPTMQRQMGLMKDALGKALTAAAETVGKGEQYASGINEYHRAAVAGKYATNAAKVAATGAGGYLGLGWLRRILAD